MTDRYAPHPATLTRSRAAQPKMAAEPRPPHPATVARSRTAQSKRASEARRPHPATLPRSFVAQPATRNPFSALLDVTGDNELTDKASKKLAEQKRQKEAKRKEEQRLAKVRQEKAAEDEAERQAEIRRQQQATRVKKQQQARKTDRVQSAAEYERTEQIEYASDHVLRGRCAEYANDLIDDRTLEPNVKFTAAVSKNTGTVVFRPSGVLDRKRLQELSPSLAGRIGNVQKKERWDPHVCSEVYATAALLKAEPGLKTNQIKYYTLYRTSGRDIAYAEPCKNCKQWINGEVLD